MSTGTQFPEVFPFAKPHYLTLDALRGVAAIMVVWYHIFEAFATSPLDQIVNHGYLAVDFFFLLSGFVIAYAYDDRWGKMSTTQFIKRRLIRLHPLVLIGVLIGAAMFYTQGCEAWDVSKVSIGALLVATLLNIFLIPATTSTEIRGIGELYPLNGPNWSLFFEYIGNLLYALVIRHLPTKLLALCVGILSVALSYFCITSSFGHIGVGWSMTTENMIGGSLRLLFSFSAGLLLSRLLPRPQALRGAFVIGALALVGLTAMPRIGNADNLWANGIYDALCIVVAFPCILYIGSRGAARSEKERRLYKALGDLSYPLYIVHYPFLYLYYAWVKNNQLSFLDSLPGALALFFGSIVLAILSLVLYDLPIRKRLSERLLTQERP